MKSSGSLESLDGLELGSEGGEILDGPRRREAVRSDDGGGGTSELDGEFGDISKTIGFETFAVGGGVGGGGEDGVDGLAADGDEGSDGGVETGLGLRKGRERRRESVGKRSRERGRSR